MSKDQGYDHIAMNTSPEDVLSRVARVKKTFRQHKTLPLEYRLEQLRNLYYGVKDYSDTLKDAIFKDFNKGHDETEFMEIQTSLVDIHDCIVNLHKWAKDEKLGFSVNSTFLTASPTITKSPLGAVLIITPWNYPFFLTFPAIASAIAAGNTVIWKPSEIVPNTSKATTLMLQNCLDPDLIQVVNGGVPETTLLLEQKFDMMMFTGSDKVGRIVAEAAAKQLTPVLLELGGKSPCFVSKTADLKISARRLMWGKLTNAGQTCIAPDFVLVEQEIEQEFAQHCINAVHEIYPVLTKDSADYSHIPTDRGFDRLVDLLERTKGDIVLGGGSDRASRFIEPTIVTNVTAADALMEEELFGPILPIITVKDLVGEGIDFVIDNHDTPLALHVFTNDKEQADTIFARTRSGSALQNETLMQCGCTDLPFGGVGTSGTGSYHGKHGFDAFSHKRSVMRQPFWAEALLKMRYPPMTASKLNMFKSLTEPSPWYPRTGPVKPGWFKMIKSCKMFWFGLLVAVAYKLKLNRYFNL